MILLSNVSILSVPDEGYSRNASCELYLISTFLVYREKLDYKLLRFTQFKIRKCYYCYRMSQIRINIFTTVSVKMKDLQIEQKTWFNFHGFQKLQHIFTKYIFNSNILIQKSNFLNEKKPNIWAQKIANTTKFWI
jgi:hypothetical protein